MQAIAPATASHDPPGVLVDDHDLAFMHDVVAVLFVEGEGLEELADGVDVFGNLDIGGLGGAA